ncbi:DUF4177 domain-containing protein [Palleronia sp. KMU-117]|uniref:DUF4177 domain-containing protein n=1 Tax=Palleronia sp. KMU-117 TaxID=3434108 RepID=UPI003D754F3D
MPRYEYKVVAAPRQGLKAKTARTPDERFANALATLINDIARDGWEYLRTDTLPMEERKGLTGRSVSYKNMLVFRRALDEAQIQTPEVRVTAIPGPAAAVPRLGAPSRGTPEDGTARAPAVGPALARADGRTDARTDGHSDGSADDKKNGAAAP